MNDRQGDWTDEEPESTLKQSHMWLKEKQNVNIYRVRSTSSELEVLVTVHLYGLLT